jgi:hypothetical protein
LGHAPLSFDGVIISRLGDDGHAGRLLRQVKMEVTGNRYGGVAQFLGMKVKKWRLQETPE